MDDLGIPLFLETPICVYLGTYFAFIVRGYNGVITHILKAYIEPSFFLGFSVRKNIFPNGGSSMVVYILVQSVKKHL